MYFYLEPLWQPDEFLSIGTELMDAYAGGDPVSLATVVKVGSGGSNQGAKLLLRMDGSTQGTLGDPELDAKAIAVAQRVAEVGNVESIMTDNGTEVFVEGFTTPPTLVMVGGGHVGKATADLANMLGYRVLVVDDRPEFANSERFPYADQTVVSDYDQWTNHVSINVNSFIVAATRGHRYDDMALESALSTPARYVGLLGSRRKTIMIYRRSDPAGYTRGAVAPGPRPHRLGHWRPDPGGTGGQHHVGDNHGPPGRERWANADGRLVYRPGGQHSPTFGYRVGAPSTHGSCRCNSCNTAGGGRVPAGWAV